MTQFASFFKKATPALFSALLALGLGSCSKESVTNDLVNAPVSTNNSMGVDDRSNGTIVDIAVGNPAFSSLVAAVLKTNSAGLLSRANLNATVFAPTNDAFALLPAPFNNAANISAITDAGQISTLGQILKYHVVSGARAAAQLPNGSYGTLRTAISPQNHLIFVSRSAAGNVFINGNTQVVIADVRASNGIIHAINRVLMPPSQALGQIAIANGNFTALLAALSKTGLTNTFMEPTNNLTVFAPTDAAFAKLPAPLNNAANIRGIRDAATIATLRSVLFYHVLGGRVFSADLREGIQPATLLTNTLSITLAGGPKVKGGGNTAASNIVATDIMGINGVIHVIDGVLLP
jgi:uncharacterized surface protein with fasciclin (FAS1) repeats